MKRATLRLGALRVRSRRERVSFGHFIPGIVFALALVACGERTVPAPALVPTVAAGSPRSIVIDTDMAADDWMAILYLLQHPNVSVQAITITGAGEAHCEPGVRHAQGLVALAGKPTMPIACGRETPLVGNHVFPLAWRQAVDTLLGLDLPDNPDAVNAGAAGELLTAILLEAPEGVTLLTLGPLTNVAEVLAAEPELADKIEQIVVMGGAVDVPGNVGSSGVPIRNETAEWNIYVDPHAANIVFRSGAPVTLVPLDATNQVPLTSDFYSRLEQEHRTPEADFVFAILSAQAGFIDSGGYYFWDLLAAAVLADESLVTMATANIVVVEAEGADSGRTALSAEGPSLRYATGVNSETFVREFLATLNRGAE